MDGKRWLVGVSIIAVVASAYGVTSLLADGASSATRTAEIPLVPLPPIPREGEVSPKITHTSPVPPRAPISPVSIPLPEYSTSAKSDPAPDTTDITPRQLWEAANERIKDLDTYIVRLTRRETIKDRANPEEVMLFKYRSAPWSVYFKWLGKEGSGREVLYVRGQHDNKIHSRLAAGDIPLMPAGRRMALSPDNILVRSAARHPITQAGIASTVNQIGRLVASHEKGDAKTGKVIPLKAVNRPEFAKVVVGLEHRLPAGLDATLPNGGVRTWFFCPTTKLPMLIVGKDEKGNEVEYYRYDRLQSNVKLDDNDFHPEALWGKAIAER
jgi:hypothetical protein